ncbi:hypothetical protein VTH82DRAFT_3306 [Thermothelomyces myriococcoides]
MKFAIFLSLASSALVLAAPASAPASDDAPAKLQKRLTCQACDVWLLNAGPACCSAHVSLTASQCIIKEHKLHGGHCDSNGYCICN